ncbi:MAG TPA: amino-acid N-acetyltransferase [Verrucomicrobiales bacterium]|nr:amino-acid N-acetyltransferase [Verrucomicrobiales bacterium]
MSEEDRGKVRFGDLRAILQYVPVFRGQTFVVAVDGAVLAAGHLSHLLLDLAVLQSLNVRVVLVYGAGHQIRTLGMERGVELTTVDGMGRTDAATLEVSIDAITRLSSTLMQALTVAGIRTATANALIAHRAGIVGGVDQEFTGVVDRVDGQSLMSFLKQGILPLVAPLGYDRQGVTLRLNSDSAAVETALTLGAAKIVFVTLGRVMDSRGEQIRHVSVEQAEALTDRAGSPEFPPHLLSKLRHAAKACRERVPRVHIVDGTRDDALLAELFSNEGIGTMVYADAYQEIRPAGPGDAAAIHAMIRSSVVEQELRDRSAEELAQEIADYYVIEVDGNAVGCMALHYFPERRAAELACLFIRRSHENQGYGRRLVAYAIDRARRDGAGQLFLLTTGARGYFERLAGFIEGKPEDLPEERKRTWEASGRRSQVLFLDLRAATPV